VKGGQLSREKQIPESDYGRRRERAGMLGGAREGKEKRGGKAKEKGPATIQARTDQSEKQICDCGSACDVAVFGMRDRGK